MSLAHFSTMNYRILADAVKRTTRNAGLLATPYLPLTLLALRAFIAGTVALPLAHLSSTSGPPGVSLTSTGGARQSPGLPPPDRRGVGGPTEREIRERSKGWEIKRLETPPWR